MKSFAVFFAVALMFACFQPIYAENTIKTGDIKESHIEIQQGAKSTEKSVAGNQVTTGNVEGSEVKIAQEAMPEGDSKKSESLWQHFYKEIITGIVVLFFGLCGWYIKRRFGGSE